MGRVRIAEHAGAAVGADIFGVMRNQAVALAGDAVLHLAGGGEFEAFLHTALGLELGHFRLLWKSALVSAWQPFQPADTIGKRAPRGIRAEMQAWREIKSSRRDWKSTRLNSSH